MKLYINKKISILLFILTLGIVSLINIDSVYAGISVKPAPGKDPGGCPSGSDCLSLGTGGMRVAVIDSRGNIVGNTVDYWYIDENNISGTFTALIPKSGTNQTVKQVYFEGKKLRQQYTGKEDVSIIKMSDDYTLNTILTKDDRKFNGILNNASTGFASGTYTNRDASVNGKTWHLNNRVGNFTETVVKRIYANFEDEYNNTDPVSGKKFPVAQYSYIDKILKDTNSGLTHSSIGINTYYIQVEPLIAWEHYNVYGLGSTNNFYGTPTEFTLMQILTKKYCKNESGVITNYFNGSFKSNLCYGFYSVGTIGVYADDQSVIPNNLFTAIATRDVPVAKNQDITMYNFMAQYFNTGRDKTNYAVGVSYISLHKLKPSGCSETVQNYVSKNSKPTVEGLRDYLEDNKINTSTWNIDWILNGEYNSKYGFEDLKELSNYFKDSSSKNCPIPECDDSLSRVDHSKIKSLYGLDNKKVYQFELADKGINGVSQSCTLIECTQDLVDKNKSEDKLKILYSYFKKEAFLNPTFLKSMDLDISDAKCEGSIPCPPVNQKISCSDGVGNYLSTTISDVSKIECLKKGIAYNKGDEDTSFAQTSKDKEYGENGYCKEEVTFTLPTSVNDIEAGTIFKWGINGKDDISSSLFGTMTVTRTCYIDRDYYSSHSKSTITSKWATVNTSNSGAEEGRINPIVNLFYSEAIPYKYMKDYYRHFGTLNAQLSNFKMRTISTTGAGATSVFGEYDYIENKVVNDIPSQDSSQKCDATTPDACIRTFKCGADCRTIDHVEMVATYNLNYSNDFKWYSDKADGYTKKNHTEIGDRDAGNANNLLLGYGLPTSFTSYPLPIGDEYHYGYSLRDDDSNGAMYVEISQIGTRNKSTDSSNTYHFDKYLAFALTDDNPADNTKLVYSCGFDIRNQLYCNECEPTAEKLNCDDNGVCKSPANSPKGLDVVFRTVTLVNDKSELNKAFPGRSGEGTRTKGVNWSKRMGIELSNEAAALILNKSIYSNEPMYKITLSTGLIQRIRKTNTKNAYTSMSNYVFAKNVYKPKTFSVDDANNLLGQCASRGRDSNSCYKAKFVLDIATENLVENDVPEEIEYTYAASNFLTKLAKDGYLEGNCINYKTKRGKYLGTSTKDRAEAYAKEFGC